MPQTVGVDDDVPSRDVSLWPMIPVAWGARWGASTVT